MRKKNILILIFTVGIMIIATVVLEKNDASKEAALVKTLQIDPEKIQSFKIERPDVTLDFQKTKDGWMFANEVPADHNYVKGLIEKMSETSFEIIPVVEGINFEKPAAKIIFPQYVLILSPRKNFEGRTYAQINSKMVLSSIELDKLILNKSIYFQNKHLFRYEESQVDKIQVQSLNENFEVKNFYADLVTKLRNITVQSYFDRPLNLRSPLVKIKVLGPQVKWQMRLSLDKKLYAEIKDQDKVYYVEYDTSYWAYFANLSRKQFVKETK